MMQCVKPNMTNLKGANGRKILEEIRNSKVPNHNRINKDIKKQEAAILAERNI